MNLAAYYASLATEPNYDFHNEVSLAPLNGIPGTQVLEINVWFSRTPPNTISHNTRKLLIRDRGLPTERVERVFELP